MDYAEARRYMKEFFERRYAELSTGSGAGVSLPFEDEGKEMWADGVDPDAEWKKWKLVPRVDKRGRARGVRGKPRREAPAADEGLPYDISPLL